ncbi:MAG: hypothetical protein EA384_06565 [Spirochaetaceae bacterium]|nr:MAG: hypothetical protein EA384_06565 [Spirochaetaceae bacterium]
MKKLALVLVVLLILATAVPARAEDDPRLYALGMVSASNLYFSYLVLGTVADGYASGGYGVDMATSLTEEAIALTRSSIDALELLITSAAIAGDDLAVVEGLIETHRLLLGQANGLLSYIEDPGNTDDFLRYRDLAWQNISQMLQF